MDIVYEKLVTNPYEPDVGIFGDEYYEATVAVSGHKSECDIDDIRDFVKENLELPNKEGYFSAHVDTVKYFEDTFEVLVYVEY